MMEADMQHEGGYKMDKSDMLANAVKGAAAGALAVWVMDRLDWFIFTHEDQRARHRTEQIRPGGLDPAHVAANRAADMAGTELHPAQPHAAGVAIHYALGIGPAAIYGMLREQLPITKPGQDYLYGLGLGLGLFLVQDEGLNQMMGLSGKQKDYPWQAHARGLAAHLTLGLVTNAVLNLMGAPRPMPKQIEQSEYIGQSAEQQDHDFMPLLPSSKTDDAQRGTLH
jgi:hypothetical protein